MAEKVQILIPTIGESVSEGTIGKWFVQEGDIVAKDQPLLEIDSDKASLEVPATASGKVRIIIPAGKTASVGSAVAEIDTSYSLGNGQSASAAKTVAKEKVSDEKKETSELKVSETDSNVHDLKGYSPSKRRAIRDGSLQAPSSTPSGTPWTSTTELREDRRPMSSLRKRIAQRLVESQQTTATLTTFNEIDMQRAMDVRKRVQEEFTSKFGVKLGFMSLFSKAVIAALQEYPDVNARIEGDSIVYTEGVNLGIAVSTDRGLVVPVVRRAHTLSCGQLEKQIADLAERAREGKLQVPEMQGGTFTITNGGVFGSLLSTPIINPPQSGILGMHKIEHRPVAVVEEKGGFRVEVRPMMYVALSYDHRLIDGVTSVGFLVKVKEYLENLDEKFVL